MALIIITCGEVQAGKATTGFTPTPAFAFDAGTIFISAGSGVN